MKVSAKLICGERLWSKCGVNFCSSLKDVRIWSMTNSSKTFPTYCRKLRRETKPKPYMMWTLNSLYWLWISFRISRMFINLFQTSALQSMIKRLATHVTDKDTWRKTEDSITSVLHEDTMLTLDNTSEAKLIWTATRRVQVPSLWSRKLTHQHLRKILPSRQKWWRSRRPKQRWPKTNVVATVFQIIPLSHARNETEIIPTHVGSRANKRGKKT